MFDHAKQIIEEIAPAKRLLSFSCKTHRGWREQHGLQQNMMILDFLVMHMRMENDDVMVIDDLCICSCMNRRLIFRVRERRLSRGRSGYVVWNEQTGNIWDKGSKGHRRDEFNHTDYAKQDLDDE